ncbi:MAG: hypothetical protein AAFQ94_09100 [Bacteroidota bacterium]
MKKVVLHALVCMLLCFAVKVYGQSGNTPDEAITLSFSGSQWSSGDDFYNLDGMQDSEPRSPSNHATKSDPNKFFKFTATSEFVRITANPGNVLARGTLWDKQTDGSYVSISHEKSGNYGSSVSVSSNSLVIGKVYYYSFEVYNTRSAFGLDVFMTPDYDYPVGAISIPHQSSWTSTNTAYSTGTALPYGPESSCITGRNRWFRFIATSTQIDVSMIEGVQPSGSLTKHALSIFNAETLQEVKCNYNNSSVTRIQTNQLTPGASYFISVIAPNGSKRGNFGLSVKNQVDYDFMESAVMIPHESFWSSSMIYSTAAATVQGESGTCAIGRNRWFKFTATTSLMDLSIIEGTLNDGNPTAHALAVFDAETLTQIDCKYGGVNSGRIQSNQLVVGQNYLVAVSAPNSSKRGNFGLVLKDHVDYDYPEGAITFPHSKSWLSQNNLYTTANATSILPQFSCVAGKNRWFKFVATSNEISIDFVGGLNPSGTTTSSHAIALFGGDLNTEYGCVYLGSQTEVNLTFDNLVIGSEYYVAITSANNQSSGIFSLRVSGGDSSGLWSVTGNTIHPTVMLNKLAINTDKVPEEYVMALKGKAIMEEIKVMFAENWPWPDYVFTESYDLKSLEEVSKFIIENGHLPNIPPASEVETNGIELARISASLLEKVEELTLYTISQEEKIKKLTVQNKQLKKQEALIQSLIDRIEKLEK